MMVPRDQFEGRIGLRLALPVLQEESGVDVSLETDIGELLRVLSLVHSKRNNIFWLVMIDNLPIERS